MSIIIFKSFMSNSFMIEDQINYYLQNQCHITKSYLHKAFKPMHKLYLIVTKNIYFRDKEMFFVTN